MFTKIKYKRSQITYLNFGMLKVSVCNKHVNFSNRCEGVNQFPALLIHHGQNVLPTIFVLYQACLL